MTLSLSRSGLETYQDCPRKFYLHYLADGRGYSSASDKAIALKQGDALHSAMEVLMKSILKGKDEPWLYALGELRSHREYLDRPDYEIVEALFFSWLRTRMAEFLEEYEIIAVEEPTEVLIKEISLYVRGDVLVRNRNSDLKFSVDWKVVSSSRNWATKWKREPQGFLQVWASRQKHTDVVGTIFEGFVKGQKRDGAYTSPLTRAYMALGEDGEPVFAFEKDAFPKGIKPVTINPGEREWPGGHGLEGWVGWLPFEVAKGSIVTSPPVTLPPDWEVWLLESEKGILRDYRDGLWERRYKDENCTWCPFDPICAGDKTLEQMVGEGSLMVRPASPREKK